MEILELKNKIPWTSTIAEWRWQFMNLKIGSIEIYPNWKNRKIVEKNNEQSSWDLWDDTRRFNIISSDTQKERRKRQILEEIVAENLSNLEDVSL